MVYVPYSTPESSSISNCELVTRYNTLSNTYRFYGTNRNVPYTNYRKESDFDGVRDVVVAKPLTSKSTSVAR